MNEVQCGECVLCIAEPSRVVEVEHFTDRQSRFLQHTKAAFLNLFVARHWVVRDSSLPDVIGNSFLKRLECVVNLAPNFRKRGQHQLLQAFLHGSHKSLGVTAGGGALDVHTHEASFIAQELQTNSSGHGGLPPHWEGWGVVQVWQRQPLDVGTPVEGGAESEPLHQQVVEQAIPPDLDAHAEVLSRTASGHREDALPILCSFH